MVLIRIGRMKVYYDAEKYMANSPGLGLGAAKWLVEEKGAMMLGADNLSFEIFPPISPAIGFPCIPICWQRREGCFWRW